MCELFSLSSRWPTRATFSLDAFASHGAVGLANVDGWGVAFYDGLEARLYKEPEPAGDSDWLAFIQKRRIASKLIVSHIRRATMGGNSFANTQPFVRELAGRVHVFAHNGRLDRIGEGVAGAPTRFLPVGETDSEFAFCILLERLSRLWKSSAVPTLDERLEIVTAFAADMRTIGPANFLYSDGDVVFAHGHRRIQASGVIAPPGLWLLRRECAFDMDAQISSGVLIDNDQTDQAIVLLASVPLTDEEWRPLAEGQIVAIRDGREVTVSTL